MSSIVDQIDWEHFRRTSSSLMTATAATPHAAPDPTPPAPTPISTPLREEFDNELQQMVNKWARRDEFIIGVQRIEGKLMVGVREGRSREVEDA